MSKASNNFPIRQEYISYIEGLIWRYARKEPLPDPEAGDLQAWVDLSPGNAVFLGQFCDVRSVINEMREMHQLDQVRAWNALDAKIKASEARVISLHRKLRRIGYAAVVGIPLIWIGVKYFTPAEHLSPAAKKAIVKEPGKFSVLLTDNDGRHIVLDSLGNKAISSANDLQVAMKGSNTLLYTLAAEGSGKALRHTLQTAKKHAFQLVFPDKSNVTLSHASQVNYLLNGEGRMEKMHLTGGALFNITPNAVKPFVLTVDSIRVEVLGTSFAVMAYPDDSVIQVSLRSGKIRVWKGSRSLTLDTVGQIRVSRDSLTLCKDPAFLFKDADLATVIRTIEKWYDVEISNPRHVRGILVTGSFSQALSLDDVLRRIETMQSGYVRFHNVSNNIEILPGK